MIKDDDEKKVKIANLIGWVIKTLESWKDVSLYSSNELIILFRVTCFLDEKGFLWKALFLHDISISDLLFDYSRKELSCLKCEFSINEDVDVPIYESESLEGFLLAISSKDWEGVSELWRIFNNRPLLSYRHIQMLYILDYFNRELLISALEGNDSVPILMNVMHYIRVETAFFIGSETKNDYLEFSSVYSTLTSQRSHKEFTDDENRYLAEIFSNVGSDNEKFNSWMNVFNKYPVRYPKIQVALGKMLATTSNRKNVEAYIKSIYINKYSDNESRQIVTECLKEIVKCSAPIRRKEVWKLAYEAWSDWNFGGVDKSNYIFRIACSELDFAIIGYIKECLTDDERLEMKKFILNNLQLFESRWHDSSSAATTYWYRNLSFYQVVEHADRVGKDIETWLLIGSSYIPGDFHKNDYSAMLVR